MHLKTAIRKPRASTTKRVAVKKTRKTAIKTRSIKSIKNLHSTSSIATFSTNATPQAEGGGEKKKEKEKKAPRTWLQIYAEMQLRELSKPLEKKVTKNDQRLKARQDHMRDFVQSADLIRKLMPDVSDDTQVWCRGWASKAPAELITFSEAIQRAKAQELQVATIRSAMSRPQKPEQMATVPDDNILPVWLMDSRAYMQELFEGDTAAVKGGSIKDIVVNTTITQDDLERKLQQCIDFLFDGNIVKISCQSKSVNRIQSLVEKNTHFDATEIAEKVETSIERGDTLDMNEFLRAKKGQPPKAAAAGGGSAPSANSVALKQQEARLNTQISKLMGELKRVQQSIDQSQQKSVKDNEAIRKDPKHRLYKEISKLPPGQLTQEQNTFIQSIMNDATSMQNEVGLLRVKLSAVKRGEMSTGKGGAFAAGADDDGGRGGDDDDDGGNGGEKPAKDEEASAEEKKKMSKRELEEHKQRAALSKMNPKEKVAYLAGLVARQTYPVMSDLVETIGKLSCIMMQERTNRKKSGETLDHDEMSPEKLAKLSNKDRKRYEQRLAAQKGDPHAALKLELANAMKLYKTKYIYNDTILEQQIKKPFWVSHNAPSLDIASKTKQLTLQLSKGAGGNTKH